MSIHSRVVWSEGLFLRPQHLQQQMRYIENFVEGRCGVLAPNGWGFSSLELDRELLGVGQLAIRRASGVLPDGTPFDMPDADPCPPALDVPQSARRSVAFLSLPARRADAREVANSSDADQAVRYTRRTIDVGDVTTSADDKVTLEVAPLRFSILLEDAELADKITVPFARVAEKRHDGRLLLDEQFIPTVTDALVSSRLTDFIRNVQGSLRDRAQRLAEEASAASAQWHFLQLQTINRYEPVFAHFATLHGVHPETVYRALLQLAGDLTIFSEVGPAPEFPPYRHQDLQPAFESVVGTVQEYLGAIIERTWQQLQLKKRGPGLFTADVTDPAMLDNCEFVLAAKAKVPEDKVRTLLPANARIASSTNPVFQNPGGMERSPIPFRALEHAPRQLPPYTGYVYFKLDPYAVATEMKRAVSSRGLPVFGFYVPVRVFPDLEMMFFAIRG